MNKFAKRAVALACAALMAAGGLVQASASSVTDTIGGARLVGTAKKISSTQASAKSEFFKGTGTIVPTCTVYVRAYIESNGSKQYGKEEKSSSTTGTAPVTGTVTTISGFGLTGYGGEHRATYVLQTSSGNLDRKLSTSSRY